MSERDNERRLQSAADDQISTKPVSGGGLQSKLDLAFAAPTLFVELPSKGKYYDQNSSLYNKQVIEIRFMTAKEEDILTSKSLIKNGLVFERLIESILVDKTIKASDLLIGDRNAILIDARISGFGSKYNTSVTCPDCNVRSKFSFLLDENKKVNSGNIPENMIKSVVYKQGKTFSITLPKTDVTVDIRLMDGNDEKSVIKISDSNKNSVVDDSNTQQLKLMIEKADEATDKSTIARFIDVMPVSDSRFLKEAYKSVTPNVDLTQQFECKSCGYIAEMEVPFNMEFFWIK